ncbi:hypothetical protein [Lactobacillus amylovorus]|uniref:hypothetical protein n=1 Tax=Lactobacillus amylovorus TaxID=1604 RepID=UPI000E47FA9E|nr:hypothetical protein [Lactobacillus amylovorus]RGW84942.1 hypothetical protein DWV49_05300 [Lactobacillus amylovorus]
MESREIINSEDGLIPISGNNDFENKLFRILFDEAKRTLKSEIEIPGKKIKQLIDYHDDVPNINYVDQITAALNKPQSIKGKKEIFKEWFLPFQKIRIYENDLTIRFYF